MADATYSRHPEWLAKAPQWVLYRDLYEGRHSVVTGPNYLWPHKVERTTAGAELRQSRQTRTRFLKVPEMIVSLWTSYFFWKPPTIDPVTMALLKSTGGDKDIDGAGTPFLRFWREKVTAPHLQFGKVGILADSFTGTAKNRAEQQAKKIRPYLQTILPLSLCDWDTETENADRIGKLNSIRYEYDSILPRGTVRKKPEVIRKCEIREIVNGVYCVTICTRKGKQSEEVTNEDSPGWTEGQTIQVEAFSEIPLVIMEDTESWIDGVCEETLRFFNLRSNKDNIEYNQGYEKLVTTGFDPNNSEMLKAASENTMLCLPPEATITSIAPVDTSGYDRSVKDSLDTIFKVGLNQFRQLSSDSKAVQSDDTIAEEKVNTIALVRSTIDDLEGAMNAAMNNYAKFNGQKDFQADIKFDRDIIEKNFEKFVAAYQAFADRLTKYPKVAKAVDRAAVRNLGLSEDETNEALKEIDAAPEVELTPQPEADPVDELLNKAKNAAQAATAPAEG